MEIELHETFLQSVNVPLRLSIAREDQPIIVPLWFKYQDGAFWCACHRNSYLVRHLKRLMTNHDQTWPCAFDISTNDIPYQGLAGTGHVALHPESGADRLHELTRRYLGQSETPFSKWLLGRAPDEVALCIQPDRVRYWNFTNRMTRTGI